MLNDYAIEEFGAGVVDPVTPPDTHPANSASVTVVPVSDEVKGVNDAVISAIAQSDVTFELVRGKVDHVVELEQVMADVLSAESIDRSQAKMIDQMYGGFFGGTLAAEQFTSTPTKVNYQYSVNYMRRQIAAEETAITTQFYEFISQLRKNLFHSVKSHLLNNMVPSYGYRFARFKAEINGLAQSLPNNPDVVFASNLGFVNILKHDILAMDWSNLQFQQYSTSLADAPANFVTRQGLVAQQLKDSPLLLSFILAVNANEPIDSIFDEKLLTTYYSKPITVGDLLKFFTSSQVADMIYLFTSRLNDACDALEKKIQNITEGMDYDKSCDALVDFGPELAKLTKEASVIANIVIGLNVLQSNFEEVAAFLKKL